jgi:hypothetical protein
MACPDWCELPLGHDAGAHQIAHRAAAWELRDRLELCIIQVVMDEARDEPPEMGAPTLYYWSADDAVLSQRECVRLACAVRRAEELLRGIAGVECSDDSHLSLGPCCHFQDDLVPTEMIFGAPSSAVSSG